MTPDLSDLNELKRHLLRHGLFAKKNFGQNFLIDTQVLDQIVSAADLNDKETVVEVGPGPGVLSQRLVPHVKQLIAIEIDEQMISPWKALMQSSEQAEIRNQDVLDFIPPDQPYKVVANIPYYITSPILKHFLRNQQVRRPDRIVLMIQKEVAQRICDLKKPTLLSWEIRVFGEPELVCVVSPRSFYPSPKVDSAVLQIQIRSEPLIGDALRDDFFDLLERSYKQPRKTLLNNLMAAGKGKEQLLQFFADANVEPGLRPHQLSIEQWKALLTCWKDS